jgi:hypothetical protein
MGKVLAALAVVVAVVGLLSACGREPGSPVALKSKLESGVLAGNLLHGVTADGKLATIDLKKGRVTEIALKDRKLARFIDVADGKACVASEDRLHVIDLKNGRELKSVPLVGKKVFGLGFAGPRQAFVHTGKEIVLVNLDWGTERKIDLGGKGGFTASAVACDRVGQRLYAAGQGVGSLSVIDLKSGKVIEQIKVPQWRFGAVRVVGDRAFVVGLCLGYGVWTNSVGQIDLKTKKFTALKTPRMLQQCSAVCTSDGALFLTDGRHTCQYDSTGKMVGPLPEKEAGRLLAVWEGKALVSNDKALKMVPLSRNTAKR